MKISALIAGLPLRGELATDFEVSGIVHDSRQVQPGDLFVALIGQRFDARAFVPEAVKRGAVAVIAPGRPPHRFELPWLETDDARQVLEKLSARFFGHPDRELLTVGVTGTNGKSTVVSLLASILEAAGRPTGVVGTLGYHFREERFRGERTTPEAPEFYQILRRMRDAGAAAVALEVSSHALELGRLASAAFDLAVFTNLSRDHFDFHRGFTDYFEAKRRLFAQLKPGGRSAVNIGDPYGARLAGELREPVTFGAGGEVRCRDAQVNADGIGGVLVTPRGELRFRSPLLGRYNLDNLVAAAAGAEALELPHEAVVGGLASSRPLPGRMEPVFCGQPFPVYIDYAHTDAALEAALRSLREFSRRRIILVFGCGGDRDAGKRALMGRVAGELAELPIITSDNPRSEDPLAIIAAVEEGVKQSGNDSYRIVPDRREAIRRAVAIADPGSAVLVAGRGHEQLQIVGERQLRFSDREELERALEERLGSAAHR